jgi:hypothetical protein
MKCVHCGEPVTPYQCAECPGQKWVQDECELCHVEVVHGIVCVQNIHVCGNDQLRLSSTDQDPDAFRVADE